MRGARERPRGEPAPAPARRRPDLTVLVLADEALAGQTMASALAASGAVRAVMYTEWSQIEEAVTDGRRQALLRFADHLNAEALTEVRELRSANPALGACLVARRFDVPGVYDLTAQRATGLSVLLRGERLSVATILRALLQLDTGAVTMTPEVLKALMAAARGDSDDLSVLSTDERAVLELVAAGLRNYEIARRLHFSEKLIEKRIGCIFEKLQLNAERHRGLDRRVAAARLFLLHQHRRDVLGV